jgi:hypothetical protein
MFAWRMLAYLLGYVAKAGSQSWRPFPENTVPLRYSYKYWISQVDLVNRTTSHFCRIPDKDMP